MRGVLLLHNTAASQHQLRVRLRLCPWGRRRGLCLQLRGLQLPWRGLWQLFAAPPVEQPLGNRLPGAQGSGHPRPRLFELPRWRGCLLRRGTGLRLRHLKRRAATC